MVKLVKLALAVACIAAVVEVATRKHTSAVLVTGTSSGIGRHAAVALACDSKFAAVFATVRKADHAEELRQQAASCGDGLVPVLMDVSSDDDVAAALVQVTSELQLRGLTLAAVVNNAGIGNMLVTESPTQDAVQRMYDVNVFGVLRVTRAFLPLLRQHGAGARVVMVSSSSAFFSLPLFTSYASTKAAVDALSNGLRRELAPFGISVSMVNPGVIQTKIQDKLLVGGFNASTVELSEQAAAGLGIDVLPPEVAGEYRRVANNVLAKNAEMQRYGMYLLPDATTVAITHAVTATYPSARYIVGADSWLLRLLAWLPLRLSDVVLQALG